MLLDLVLLFGSPALGFLLLVLPRGGWDLAEPVFFRAKPRAGPSSADLRRCDRDAGADVTDGACGAVGGVVWVHIETLRGRRGSTR